MIRVDLHCHTCYSHDSFAEVDAVLEQASRRGLTHLAITDHDGFAFASSAVAIAALVGSIFIDLYPNVMVSSTNAAYNLTVNNSASGHYALTVMTVVAVIFFPLVLIYQGWSFHVFRARLKSPAPASAPADRPPTAQPAAPPA